MKSLHVICGLGPPIKNPGYAYVWIPPLKMEPQKINFLNGLSLSGISFCSQLIFKTEIL